MEIALDTFLTFEAGVRCEESDAAMAA